MIFYQMRGHSRWLSVYLWDKCPFVPETNRLLDKKTVRKKKNPYLGYTWFGGALFCLQKSCHNYNFVLLPEPNLMNKDISIMTVFKCRWLYKIPKCVQRENKQQSPSFSSPNFSKLREPPAEGSEFLLHWLDKTFFQISQITFVWVSTAALSKRPDGKINCRRK